MFIYFFYCDSKTIFEGQALYFNSVNIAYLWGIIRSPKSTELVTLSPSFTTGDCLFWTFLMSQYIEGGPTLSFRNRVLGEPKQLKTSVSENWEQDRPEIPRGRQHEWVSLFVHIQTVCFTVWTKTVETLFRISFLCLCSRKKKNILEMVCQKPLNSVFRTWNS